MVILVHRDDFRKFTHLGHSSVLLKDHNLLTVPPKLLYCKRRVIWIKPSKSYSIRENIQMKISLIETEILNCEGLN